MMLRSVLVTLLFGVCSGMAFAQEQSVRIIGTDLAVIAPAEWKLQRSIEGAEFVLQGPPADDVADDAERERSRPRLSVAVTPMRSDDTQAALAYRSLQDLERLLTNCHPLDWSFSYTVGARQWQRLHYSFRTGQLEWEQELYITSSGSTAVCMTFSSDRAHFAHWRPQFDRMVAAMSGSSLELER
jgi:hypothetical protein